MNGPTSEIILHRLLLSLLVLSACNPEPTPDPTPEPDTDPAPAPTEACGDPELVITIPTADGETLEADWWPAEDADSPVAVMFHMNPTSFDRTGYPKRVREALHDAGFAVLNVDRRGAGGSSGDAADATDGPGALADAEAAVRFVTDPARDCPVAATAVHLIGASNGTTPVFDYFVSHDPALPDPAGVAWLSPGDYTASNNRLTPDTYRDDYAPLWNLSVPFFLAHPAVEPWSRDFHDETAPGFVVDAPGIWCFKERGEAHGTDMFDGSSLEDETLRDLIATWTDRESLSCDNN